MKREPNNLSGKEATGYLPDGHWQDIWVEVKSQINSFRDLRASLLGFAYFLSQDPASRGLVVLVNSRITEERLQRELNLAKQVLRQDVMQRLSIAVKKGEHYLGLPPDLGDSFRGWLDQLVFRESHGAVRSRGIFYSIFEILMHQWMLGKGPVTRDWLAKTAGCSYPTVAAALRRLDHDLLRHSDRRVELRGFPRDEWSRLLAASDDVRATTRFADRSGQPRSPESLLHRLQTLYRSDLAVGGVWGAKHYHASLNLVGNPRLDLSLYCPTKAVDLAFVERLDPALEKTTRRDEPASLIVHLVRRAVSFFQPGEDGIMWADPVECLLDLHEARLEPQARDFLNSFPAAKGAV